MENTKIDRIDYSILKELQKDGRLTIQKLSEKIGLSPSPCARRLAILEQADIINGYHALIDEAKVGYPVSVFVSVKLEKQIDDSLQKFEKSIDKYPEVVDCWLMTGNRDYLLRIAVSNLLEFEKFLTSKLTKIPGVASIESSIPIRRVKAGISRLI